MLDLCTVHSGVLVIVIVMPLRLGFIYVSYCVKGVLPTICVHCLLYLSRQSRPMPANQHHTEYAPPVLRAPSPASSIGTTYGEDQTSFSDCEDQLSQPAFERKWEERIGLGAPQKEEIEANQEPLLARPLGGSAEERQLYEQVMANLHAAVQNLEDNELFEQTLLRGSQAALEPQPSTTDIDLLMRSMMVAPQRSTNVAETGHARGRSDGRGSGVTNGTVAINGREVQNDAAAGGTLLTTGVTPGKRSRNGSRRN